MRSLALVGIVAVIVLVVILPALIKFQTVIEILLTAIN
jgi:hypothetical protein